MPYTSNYLAGDSISVEFLKIEEALLDSFDYLYLRELNVAPEKPRAGQLFRCDGTNWDAGYGAGIYEFDGTNFIKLVQLKSTGVLNIPQLTSAPSSPVTGDTALADGVSWNPGSGQGVYCYYNSAWNYLG